MPFRRQWHDFRFARGWTLAECVRVMKFGKLIIVGVVIGLLLVTLREALAGDPALETQAIQHETLQRFTLAFVTVRELNAIYRREIEQSDGPEEAAELRDEARATMTEAIERTGLKVGEYNFIAHQLQRNPSLFMTLDEMLAP